MDKEIRDLVNSIADQLENDFTVCPRCSHEDPTATLDVTKDVRRLRSLVNNAKPNPVEEAVRKATEHLAHAFADKCHLTQQSPGVCTLYDHEGNALVHDMAIEIVGQKTLSGTMEVHGAMIYMAIMGPFKLYFQGVPIYCNGQTDEKTLVPMLQLEAIG